MVIYRRSSVVAVSSCSAIVVTATVVDQDDVVERTLPTVSVDALMAHDPHAIAAVCEAFVTGSVNALLVNNVRTLRENAWAPKVIETLRSQNLQGNEQPYTSWIAEPRRTPPSGETSRSGLDRRIEKLRELPRGALGNIEDAGTCRVRCVEEVGCVAWMYGLPGCAGSFPAAGRCSLRGSLANDVLRGNVWPWHVARSWAGGQGQRCVVSGFINLPHPAAGSNHTPPVITLDNYVFRPSSLPGRRQILPFSDRSNDSHSMRSRASAVPKHEMYRFLEILGSELWSVSRAVAQAIDSCMQSHASSLHFPRLEGHLLSAPGGFVRLLHYAGAVVNERVSGASAVGVGKAEQAPDERWLWREWHCDRSVITLALPSVTLDGQDWTVHQDSERLLYRDRRGAFYRVPPRAEDTLLVHLGVGAEVAVAEATNTAGSSSRGNSTDAHRLPVLSCTPHAVATDRPTQAFISSTLSRLDAEASHHQPTKTVEFGLQRLWIGHFTQPIPGDVATAHPIVRCGHRSDDGGGVWAFGHLCGDSVDQTYGQSFGGRLMGLSRDVGRPADVLCCGGLPAPNRHYYDIPFVAHSLGA
eukprot:TRINITY_DN23584_c0_g1_i1.p1 TRINITY_DN23584_c0_g1~~TRINITY_DN23584_c0_g1_i1.p1  ORF type:complete len:592 (+),score=45.99 TRINITY_DN23584_c0_g1_i1:28-1776(+)